MLPDLIRREKKSFMLWRPGSRTALSHLLTFNPQSEIRNVKSAIE